MTCNPGNSTINEFGTSKLYGKVILHNNVAHTIKSYIHVPKINVNCMQLGDLQPLDDLE